MSAAADTQDGATSPALRAATGGPPPRDEAPRDEFLDTLLPRYARIGRRLAGAEACVVRVRRSGERWHVGHAGEPGEAIGDGFAERVRGGGMRREELSGGGGRAGGVAVGLPVGTLGSLSLRLAPGGTLGAEAERDLHDLVALLCREVGGGTERAAAEEAARAAAVEVEHQMRNGFAKINAMIDLAAREGLGDRALVGALKRRLAALGEANEVAIAHGFGPAPLDVVMRAALAVVLGRLQGDGVVSVSGDPLVVSPAVASVLAPIFSEVAADAAARGRLSADHPVRLSWSVQEESGRAVFRWQEASPSEDEPFAPAFLRSGGPSTLRGEATIEPDAKGRGGASYRLAIPDRFVSRPD